MTNSDATPKSTVSASAWRSLMVLSAAFGIVSTSLNVMNVVFDAILAEFSATSTATLGWVITGYTTMTAALLIASGRIADAYGRKRVFLFGLQLFLVSSVLGAVAWNPAVIIIARVLQGAATALVTPTSLALLLGIFPAERRSAAIGIWGSVAAVAAAGGPALGGLIVDEFGWRWVFWLFVPLTGVAWISSRMLVEHEDTFSEGETPDVFGIALSALAVGLLALGLAQSGEWGWGDERTIAALVAGPLIGAWLIYRSRTHPIPVLDLALFRFRSFSVGNGVTLLFSIAFSAMILANVLFLARVWDYSQAGAGLGIVPSPLSAAVVAPFAGRLADKFGPRALIVPGTGLFTAGLVFLAVGIGTEPQYWTHWFPAAICFGTGIGLTFTNVSSISVAEAPPSQFAVASATNSTARAVGSVLGPAFVIGTIGAAGGVGSTDLFDRVWLVSAAIAAASSLLAVCLPVLGRET